MLGEGFTSARVKRLCALGMGPRDLLNVPGDPEAFHYEVAGLLVPPYEGVFLSGHAQLGGEREAELLRSWALAGQPAPSDSVEHIGSLCLLLAALLESPGGSQAASRLAEEHILGWLPALNCAWERENATAYITVGRVLLELVLMCTEEHSHTDGVVRTSQDEEGLPTDDTEAGLREIGGFLTCHARSGVFLGRGAIARMGRQAGIPRGFGSTRLMMGNLLRSAAHYGAMGQVLDLLDQEAQAFERTWKETYRSHSSLTGWSAHWLGRIARTRSMFLTMRGALKV